MAYSTFDVGESGQHTGRKLRVELDVGRSDKVALMARCTIPSPFNSEGIVPADSPWAVALDSSAECDQKMIRMCVHDVTLIESLYRG